MIDYFQFKYDGRVYKFNKIDCGSFKCNGHVVECPSHTMAGDWLTEFIDDKFGKGLHPKLHKFIFNSLDFLTRDL